MPPRPSPGRGGQPVRNRPQDLATEPAGGFTAAVEEASLDPFRGYANAIRDELPDSVAVFDAFHVVPVANPGRR
jgi:transposase